MRGVGGGGGGGGGGGKVCGGGKLQARVSIPGVCGWGGGGILPPPLPVRRKIGNNKYWNFSNALFNGKFYLN